MDMQMRRKFLVFHSHLSPELSTRFASNLRPSCSAIAMAPMKAMKAMKKSGAKALTKGGLAEALAAQTELKKSDCMKVASRKVTTTTARAARWHLHHSYQK